MECKLLMMATSNIFSPSSGKPILTPSQDIVLGAYYLTIEPRKKAAKEPARAAALGPAGGALRQGRRRRSRCTTGSTSRTRTSAATPSTATRRRRSSRTTVGRVIFNQIWPAGARLRQLPRPKSKLGDLILNTYKVAGDTVTVETLDKLKELGFTTALPGRHLDRHRRHDHPGVEEGHRARLAQARSPRSRPSSTRASSPTASATTRWSTSGPPRPTNRQGGLRQARGQRRQDRGQPRLHHDGLRRPRQQAAGPPALRRARPHGQALRRNHRAARSSPRSARGSRSSNTSSRPTAPARASPTPPSRPPTPATSRASCATWPWTSSSPRTTAARATASGRRPSIEGDDEIVGLQERIIGRCSSDDVNNPLKPSEIIVGSGELITEEIAAKIEDVGIERVKIMSPLTSIRQAAASTRSPTGSTRRRTGSPRSATRSASSPPSRSASPARS